MRKVRKIKCAHLNENKVFTIEKSHSVACGPFDFTIEKGPSVGYACGPFDLKHNATNTMAETRLSTFRWAPYSAPTFPPPFLIIQGHL